MLPDPALVLSMFCGSTSARECHQEVPLELKNDLGGITVPEGMCDGTVVQNIDLHYKPTVYLHSNKPESDQNDYTIILLMKNVKNVSKKVSRILWLVSNMKLGLSKCLRNGITLMDYVRPPNFRAHFTLIVYNRTNTSSLSDFEVSKPKTNSTRFLHPDDQVSWILDNQLKELSRMTFVNHLSPKRKYAFARGGSLSSSTLIFPHHYKNVFLSASIYTGEQCGL